MPQNASFIVPEDLYRWRGWKTLIFRRMAVGVLCQLTVDQPRNVYHRALWLVPTSGGAPRNSPADSPGL